MDSMYTKFGVDNLSRFFRVRTNTHTHTQTQNQDLLLHVVRAH